jgi:hypothetical protein
MIFTSRIRPWTYKPCPPSALKQGCLASSADTLIRLNFPSAVPHDAYPNKHPVFNSYKPSQMEVSFDSMADWEAFLSSVPFQEHKAWTQRIQSMVVDGSPVWHVHRSVPLAAAGSSSTAAAATASGSRAAGASRSNGTGGGSSSSLVITDQVGVVAGGVAAIKQGPAVLPLVGWVIDIMQQGSFCTLPL